MYMDPITLKQIIQSSFTRKEVLQKLFLRAAGGNYNTLNKYIELWNIDISHFKKSHDFIPKQQAIAIELILVENSTYSRNHLKERLYKEGYKQRICEHCGQDENWNGKKMSLILDHINGMWNDNRLENLQIVCPNCNATLDTHCAKNIPKKEKIVKPRKRKVERPSKEQLLQEITELGYSAVGRKYGVSDNAIRKWIK